jgi:hypothetical protein
MTYPTGEHVAQDRDQQRAAFAREHVPRAHEITVGQPLQSTKHKARQMPDRARARPP